MVNKNFFVIGIILCIKIIFGNTNEMNDRVTITFIEDTIDGVKYPIYYLPARVEGINGIAIAIGLGIYNDVDNPITINGLSLTVINIPIGGYCIINGLNIEFCGTGFFYPLMWNEIFNIERVYEGYKKNVDKKSLGNIEVNIVRGISLSAFGAMPSHMFGANISLYCSAQSYCNGVSIAPLSSFAGVLKGVSLSAINGSALANGVQLGLYNNAGEIFGLQLGLINSSINAQGVQIGVVNNATNLQGVQIGLLNLEGNVFDQGKLGFPLINWKF